MYKLIFKRLFDIFLAVILIVIFSPLFILSIALIFIGDGKPFFYKQQRIGQGGNVFNVIKLRTMKQGMESMGTTSYANDPRYFFGSKVLRSMKLDELPQLINILFGDMSLVGPRPTVQEDFDKMTHEQKRRFRVRPGLTGLAQISGNTSLKWPERVELDIQYIVALSFKQDFKILIKTVTMWVSNKLDSAPPETGEW